MESLEQKRRDLREIIRNMDSVVVAFSGGVDSSLVAAYAYDVLGQRAVAGTARSVSMPPGELEEATYLAQHIGIKHVVVDSLEVEDPRYLSNDLRRCYFCRLEQYAELEYLASDMSLQWVADGSNLDDSGDLRPGMTAAKSLKVRSPLIEARLNKKWVRALAKDRELPNWDKPAEACLASRVPYGTVISKETLLQISAAETVLKLLGFSGFRVRHHKDIARIEVQQEDLSLFIEEDTRQQIVKKFREIGYSFVTLDLSGYKYGSLNPRLRQDN